MKIRVRVFVSGRVQGVFFREETMYRAKEHHVAGWVRNLSDGRVEAVFEGEDRDVTKMIEFCRRGPPAARVTSVEVREEPYSDEYVDFEII
jgi:acylphosphatase